MSKWIDADRLKNSALGKHKSLEQRKVDGELFMKIYSLFEKMSKKGKVATIETLSYIIDLNIAIEEEIRKRRNNKC